MPTTEGQGAIATGSREPPESWLLSLVGALGPGSARASAWIATGTIVDGCYRIERALAAGGMAVVYLAHDLELDRNVALKLYDVDARELSLSRIYREARAMAQLSHPNVLVVHGVGVHEQRVFLAMEYVEGETLRGWLAHEPRDPTRIVEIFVACARGLAAAHAVGLAHGDFKPDNVLVGRDDRPRVADFGLARTIGSAWERPSSALDSPLPSSAPGPATVTTGFAGTRAYAAPEVQRGAPADQRADQFSFCVALFEALHRVHPYEGDDADAQLDSMRAGRMRPRPSTAVPLRIHRAIVRGLAPDPADRFASLDDLVAALSTDPWGRRTRVAMGASLVGTVALGLAWPRPSGCEQADAGLDDSWNDARADALATSFAASESPIATPVHRAVTERIDRWADDWRAHRREACVATRERAEQSDEMLDRRMLCLDRQRDRLVSVLAVLDGADREVVGRAEDLIAGLPAPERCSDVDRLLEQLPPPEDPELAAAVDRASRELDDASVAIDVGRYRDAAEIATRVRDGEPAAAYRPLFAEASLVLGIARSRSFDNAAGDLALSDAFHVATALGDDETAAIAARELLCNLAQVAGSTDRMEVWSRIAESTGRRSGEHDGERLGRLACEGLALNAAGRFGDAETLLRGAIAEADAVTLPDSLVPAELHERLGSTLFTLERNAEAAEEHQRAVDLATAVRGPTHPLVLNARSNLAQDFTRLGRYGDALAIELDVVRATIEIFGPRSPRLVSEYNKLATVLDGFGAMPEALAYRNQGIAIGRERGDQGRALVVVLGNQASNIFQTGDKAAGLAMMAEAVQIAESVYGPTHPDTGKVLLNYGALLANALRPDEAEVELHRGLQILESAFGQMHPATGGVHLNLAMLALDRKRLDDAAFELAAAMRVADATKDVRLEIYVTAGRAELQRARGDLEGALPLQRRVVELCRGVDPISERIETFRLADDEYRLGDATAALEDFARARELARTQTNTTRVAAAELALARASWALGRRAEARRWAKTARATWSTIDEAVGVAQCDTWLAEHR